MANTNTNILGLTKKDNNEYEYYDWYLKVEFKYKFLSHTVVVVIV